MIYFQQKKMGCAWINSLHSFYSYLSSSWEYLRVVVDHKACEKNSSLTFLNILGMFFYLLTKTNQLVILSLFIGFIFYS